MNQYIFALHLGEQLIFGYIEAADRADADAQLAEWLKRDKLKPTKISVMGVYSKFQVVNVPNWNPPSPV